MSACPDPGVVHLWRSGARDISGVLSDSEERYARTLAAPRAAEYRAGRAFSRAVLRTYAGADRDLRFDVTARGKPVVRGTPLHFNLAHAGEALCVAVAASPVGVDVEALDDFPDRGAVARIVFCEAELALCETPVGFARLWVRKEALLKALGSGFLREPRSISVVSGLVVLEGVSWAIWDDVTDVATGVALRSEAVCVEPRELRRDQSSGASHSNAE